MASTTKGITPMTTIRSAGLCLTLLAGAAASARAQATGASLQELFQKLDVNKDGVVERSEVPPRAIPSFERLLKAADKNKDGKLEADEMAAVAKNMPAAGGGRPGAGAAAKAAGKAAGNLPPAFSPNPLARFKAMDKNSDGKVSRDEFTGRPQLFDRLDSNKDNFIEQSELKPLLAMANAPGAAAPAGGAGQGGARVMAMDKDGDGKVSKKEFTGNPAMFDRLDANSDGFLNATEAAEAPKAMLKFLQAMDTNGDGKISREEFRGPPERFDALDADMDGFVSFEEIAKAAPAVGAAMPAPEGKDEKKGAETAKKKPEA
jgi:Ca2+-binding EF-hand superfamily protein